MKKIILLSFFMFVSFVIVKGQEVENKLKRNDSVQELYFLSDCFYDTVNLFGYDEKDSMFYLHRKKVAIQRNVYHSKKLSQLKEPVINVEYPTDVFRFTWIQSFEKKHNPMTLRVERIHDSTMVVVKYIQYDKKVIELISDSVFISNNHWDLFCATVDSLCFFDMQPIEKSDILVMDGSIWILEGKINDTYHMVHRVEGKHKDIGLICLQLVGYFNIGNIEFKL